MSGNSMQGLLVILAATPSGSKRWTFIWQMIVRTFISLLFVPVLIMGVQADDLSLLKHIIAIFLSLFVFIFFLINTAKSIKNYRRTYL